MIPSPENFFGMSYFEYIKIRDSILTRDFESLNPTEKQIYNRERFRKRIHEEEGKYNI
jgi:hypothetical protein